jgi:pentatricopeptide repeat protein
MKRSGIEPSEACFFFILDGLFARERYDLARHVWHTVTHTRQFKPKQVTVCGCVCYRALCGFFARFPCQEFYDMALTGFSKGGSLEDISAVYERMRRDKYGALTPSPNVAVACFQR